MNKLLALGLLIVGTVMCFVVYWGIDDGTIALKGGGQVTRAEVPISFWVVTALHALVPAVLFVLAVVLLRRK